MYFHMDIYFICQRLDYLHFPIELVEPTQAENDGTWDSYPGLFDLKAFNLSCMVELPIETVFVVVVGGSGWAAGRGTQCSWKHAYQSNCIERSRVKNLVFSIYVVGSQRLLELCLGKWEFPSWVLGSCVLNCLEKWGFVDSIKRLVWTVEQSCRSKPEPSWWEEKAHDKWKQVTKVLLMGINDKVNIGAKRYVGNKEDLWDYIPVKWRWKYHEKRKPRGFSREVTLLFGTKIEHFKNLQLRDNLEINEL